MRKTFKTGVAGALCASIAVTVLPSELWAGPMSATDPATFGLSPPVEKIHYRRYWGHRRYYHHPYRRHYYRRYHYGYDPGAALFLGAAAGLVGAGIAASTYRRHYYYPSYGYGYPAYGYGWGGYPGYYYGGGW